MRVLYITTISGTINAFLIPHIQDLLRQGYKIDIACNIKTELKEEVHKLGCKVYNLPFSRNPLSKGNLTAFKELKKIITTYKYNIIHTHTPVASVVSRLVCKRNPDVSVVYTAHGFHFFKGAPLRYWALFYPVEKRLSRYTDVLITMNKEDYQIAINRKFKAKKTVKIPGIGIDLGKFKPVSTSKKVTLRNEYGYNNDDFILFYAAELNKNKHQDLLIKSISILRDKIPNIKLLLAGNGPLKNEYKRLAKKLKVSKAIEFLGYRKDINNLLSISDLVVASSKREGLPINIMEAMAKGLPVVATNIRGHHDLINDGVNGFLIGKNKTTDFSKSIEELYYNKNLREKFKQKNIELVKAYSIENVLNKMEKIYDYLN